MAGLFQKVIDFLSRPLDVEDYEAIGVKFGEQLAVKEMAIYIAVSYIANAISRCEIKTYKGGKETKDELYYLLNVNPNPNQNSSQLMQQVVENYYYRGAALLVPWRSKSIYCARGFSEETVPRGNNIFSNVDIEGETINRTFRAKDVFYFKLDNRRAANLISSMYSEYGKLIEAAMTRFKVNNQEKYKLVLDNYSAGDPSFVNDYNNVISKQLKTFLESDKAVYPQFRGTDLQPLIMSGGGTSSDIINLRKDVFEVTAQAFRIPLSMMQGNITNMSEIVKVFLSFTVDPVAQMFSEELTRKTTDFESWRAGDYVKIDTSTINHVDILEIADSIDKLIASGAFTINQILTRCGYDTLEDEAADAHYLTKNYAPIGDVADQMGGGANNEA